MSLSATSPTERERRALPYELAHDPVQVGPRDEVVVLLGPIGADRSTWATQVGALSERGLTALALDLRGHGQSPKPQGPYTMEALAEDVQTTLDGLGIPSAHLVGLSMGGAVAQQLAITAPARVTTLTLISTSARFGEPETWLRRAAAVRAEGTAMIADALEGRWLSPSYCAQHPAVLAGLRTMVLNADREGYAACAEALARWDARAQLDKISAPTLVIGGADDPSTTPAALRDLASAIPGARHVTVDGRHLVNVERAGATSDLIADHVRRAGCGPAPD